MPDTYYNPPDWAFPYDSPWTSTATTVPTFWTLWANPTGGTASAIYQTQRFMVPVRELYRPSAPAIIRSQNVGDRPVSYVQSQQLANDRALNLLLAHLSSEQRKTFKENRWFVVEGGKSKRKYKIHGNGSLVGNVEIMNDNANLCAHLDHSIPLGDQLLAQMVMLELDEDHFVATANVHRR